MSEFFQENNENNEMNNTFYREVIERKPEKSSRKFIALVLAAGLMIGTIFGYGMDNFLPNPGRDANNVYAAAVDNTKIVYSGTVSPVVPIAEKVSPSIVAISLKTRSRDFFGRVYEGQGTGSGIIIDKQGHIITNNHVVEGANDIIVILHDGKELEATLIGRDSQTDLAVIKVDADNLTVAELGDSSALKVGELAVAIGSPMGTEYAGSVTAGIISGLNRTVSIGDDSIKLIQTDAAINPGNSGGALVNSEGKVIGINTIKFAETRVEGMGFAIPINEAKPIIEDLINNKKVLRPYLGIQGITISKEEAEEYKLTQGVYVRVVIPGSGADAAGVRRGDIITKIDDKKVLTIEDLIAEIQKHKVGDTVKIEVYNQGNEYKTLNVKLTA
ncbi:MAG TPA: trypsin-like peptidase domain-containing protein, partial [Bacillota bacterium]|nr:trypsin-like peptidase domain-containing protein [Bacillota bacterium]